MRSSLLSCWYVFFYILFSAYLKKKIKINKDLGKQRVLIKALLPSLLQE